MNTIMKKTLIALASVLLMAGASAQQLQYNSVVTQEQSGLTNLLTSIVGTDASLSNNLVTAFQAADVATSNALWTLLTQTITNQDVATSNALITLINSQVNLASNLANTKISTNAGTGFGNHFDSPILTGASTVGTNASLHFSDFEGGNSLVIFSAGDIDALPVTATNGYVLTSSDNASVWRPIEVPSGSTIDSPTLTGTVTAELNSSFHFNDFDGANSLAIFSAGDLDALPVTSTNGYVLTSQDNAAIWRPASGGGISSAIGPWITTNSGGIQLTNINGFTGIIAFSNGVPIASTNLISSNNYIFVQSPISFNQGATFQSGLISTNGNNSIGPLNWGVNPNNNYLLDFSVTAAASAGTVLSNDLLRIGGVQAIHVLATSDGAGAATNRQLRLNFGAGSLATNSAVNIASTGWTNTFGKNATVYIDGTGVTYTVKNNQGISVYTNASLVANATVNLQPNGAVVISAGTGVTGVATPW